MSPKSRGRPPGRGRRRTGGRRPGNPSVLRSPGRVTAVRSRDTDCWFDEPAEGDRRSWAMPAAHGSYQGIELDQLDPGDEEQLMLLVEARHPELWDALESGDELLIDGEPMNPQLHVATHHIVANQLLANDPPETWQTVQRLAGLGHDWHNIHHMIGALVAENVWRIQTTREPFDRADYARRLAALPGDWPPPD